MTPDGLITIAALLFVGMCFAAASGAAWIALGFFFVFTIIVAFGARWLTKSDS